MTSRLWLIIRLVTSLTCTAQRSDPTQGYDRRRPWTLYYTHISPAPLKADEYINFVQAKIESTRNSMGDSPSLFFSTTTDVRSSWKSFVPDGPVHALICTVG